MLSTEIKNTLEKAVIAPLFHHTIIKIQGEEAQSFLQSQLTNDVTFASHDKAQLQAYCNAKGRAHCVFRLIKDAKHNDSYYLILPDELSDKVLGILKMYLLRAKATITIDNEQKAFIALNQVIQETQLSTLSNSQIVSIAGQYERHLILSDKNDSDQLIQSQYYNDTFDYHRLHDIFGAIGQVYNATYNQFIPQFLNLDLLDGINFKKGCFPGQEIVARLRYLGKIKQRMIIAQTTQPLNIGDKIFSSDAKAIGTIANQISVDKNTLANIVINSDYLDPELPIYLEDKTVLDRIDMPYETPIEYAKQ